MLSLARRKDAGKGMGIEMEESEIEEGEACSFKEDDVTIDPDMTFSYIGEKIQSVLGHFQKDFEGGVSYENLGRKIGDYGSFLPENLCLTPTPSQSGSLQKFPPNITSRTPNSASSENLMFQKNIPVTLRKAPIPNVSQLQSSKKIEEHVIRPNIGERSCQPDLGNSDSKSTHQKTLKVRIKVGSDASRAKPSCSIYNIMGLESSPLSSLDSSYPNGGSSQEFPKSICQIMTCSHVPAESIVSPLRETFLLLMDNFTPDPINSSLTISNADLETFTVSGNEKKLKVKCLNSSETPHSREVVSGAVVAPKKCHDSRIMSECGNGRDGSSGLNDCDNILSNIRPSSSVITIDNAETSAGNFKKPPQLKGNSNFKNLNNQAFEGVSSQLAENMNKHEKITGRYDVKKDVNSKSEQHADVKEQKVLKMHGETSKKQLKSRKSVSHTNTMHSVEISNDRKKRSHSKVDPSKFEESSKYGTIASKFEESHEVHIQDRQNDAVDHASYEKIASTVDPSEREHDRRKDQSLSSSEVSQTGMKESSFVSNGLSCHETPAPAAVLVEENWVCCDMCQKWRLLPYGIDPKQLPLKWLCTMQVWLPGLNKCTVSEDETTNALHASYQPPLSENRASNSLNNFSEAVGQYNSSLLPHNLIKKKLTLKSSDLTVKSHDIVKNRSLNNSTHVLPRSSQHFKLESNDDSKIAEKTVSQHLDNGFQGCGFLETKKKFSKSKFNPVKDQNESRASKKLKAEEVSIPDTSKRLASSHADHKMAPFKWSHKSSPMDDDTILGKDIHAKSSSNGTHQEQVSTFEKENLKDFSGGKRKFSRCDFSPSNSRNGRETHSESDTKKEKSLRHLIKEGIDTVRVSKEVKWVPSKSNKKTFDGSGEERKSGLSSRRTLNGVDPEKKDLSHRCSSTPALSSSSKVSGSCKSKSNLQEARGSPVESVSSSPLRASNGDDLGKEKDNKTYFTVCDPSLSINDCHGRDGRRSYDNHNSFTSSGQQMQTKETSRSREKHRIPKPKAFRDEELPSGKRKEDQLSPRAQEDLESHNFQSRLEGEATNIATNVGKPLSNSKPQIQREPLVLAPSMASSVTKLEEEGRKQIMEQSSRRWTTKTLDGLSPLRKDSNHSNYTAILREARDLKHTADRIKNEGLETESTVLYFEAALKFLHVASLRETSHADGETTPSMEIYSSTAKLCEFCAHLYEKRREMAAAALAYKCMEVANMKVVYSKDSRANKDRNELHAAFLLGSTGESPSSSASDIDNLNNQNAAEQFIPGKAVTSPRHNGNHVILAQNRPNFLRLFSFVQDVHDAMEASRRSLGAFNAINGMKSEEHRYGPEIIASVKQALHLSFHDVEALLRLVRLCMGSISC